MPETPSSPSRKKSTTVSKPPGVGRATRGRDSDPVFCFYCDALLPGRYDADHFPIPQALGGKATVPACMNCHELKDRTSFNDWPATHVLEHIGDIPPLALMIGYSVLRGNHQATDADVADMLKDWTSVPPRARIVLAKMVRAVVGVTAHRAAQATE